MQLSIRMNLNNAAFVGADDDYGPGPEVARILRELADQLDLGDIRPGRMTGNLVDFNGNRTGRWAIGTGSVDLDKVLR